MLRDWSDVYSVGIPEIDEQHQGFFAASHRLYEQILDRDAKQGVQEALAFMRHYADSHFQAEEAFMRQHDYPALKAHQALHAAFFARLDALAEDLATFGPSPDLADRALDLTQDWLVEHIADEDVLYALHARSQTADA
ncbi:bacteriohemerythrin [uncultured Thiodictyon sp.]|uniref:bacteriohemerythrin n=2 Tax=uncultured Thiodictyon sp. TaxID=1846217 RepID=UPI0025ED8A66|nr:hemerythrin family protein [uncultured Thiodictyon sp.]